MEIKIRTSRKFELVNITEEAEKIISESKISDGICVVYAPHATGAIIINESADPEITKDILDKLNELVPEHANYRHDRIDSNAQAHIKAALLSPSQTIPIKNSKLQLGTWQSIFFAELDGPKSRTIIVQIIGE